MKLVGKLSTPQTQITQDQADVIGTNNASFHSMSIRYEIQIGRQIFF